MTAVTMFMCPMLTCIQSTKTAVVSRQNHRLVCIACHVLTDNVLRMVQVVANSLTACRHYASCDAALQAAVSRHKGDCADVTKKRAKKEVLRLVADLLTAVEDLAT